MLCIYYSYNYKLESAFEHKTLGMLHGISCTHFTEKGVSGGGEVTITLRARDETNCKVQWLALILFYIIVIDCNSRAEVDWRLSRRIWTIFYCSGKY